MSVSLLSKGELGYNLLSQSAEVRGQSSIGHVLYTSGRLYLRYEASRQLGPYLRGITSLFLSVRMKAENRMNTTWRCR